MIGLAVMAGVAACGRSDGGAKPAAPPAAGATPARSQPAPAPAPPPLANTTPTPAPVAPVAPETLGALLPEVAGWTRSSARSELVPTPAAYSRAEAHYERAGGTIELVLADSGFQPLILAPVSVSIGAGSAERSGDLLRRAITLAGSPGSEAWSPSARRAEVVLVVAQRFIVTATGAEVPDLEPVRAAVRAVDLARLARLR